MLETKLAKKHYKQQEFYYLWLMRKTVNTGNKFSTFGSTQPNPNNLNANRYRYGFGGMEQDKQTGSYTTYFRQYDPRIARWKSTYTAFDNNPILYVDPMGDVSWCGIGTVFSGLASFAGNMALRALPTLGLNIALNNFLPNATHTGNNSGRFLGLNNNDAIRKEADKRIGYKNETKLTADQLNKIAKEWSQTETSQTEMNGWEFYQCSDCANSGGRTEQSGQNIRVKVKLKTDEEIFEEVEREMGSLHSIPYTKEIINEPETGIDDINFHDIKGQYEFMLDPNRLKTSNHIEVIKRVSNLAKKNGRTVVITGGNGANAHSIANEILGQVKQHGVNGAKIKVVNGTSPAIKLVK
ncbi:MAG: hypothetical protein HJHJAOHD_02525 [Flavobacteriales bacterium]|nr:hypothetical protein [Flavobacteriales bacterium]